MRKIRKENLVLVGALVVFVLFVAYMVVRESGYGSSFVLNRNDVIKFFSERINEVSPEKPVLGGRWLTTRFRFTGSSSVYVEYEDGHIARAFLLSLNRGVGSVPDYKIVGFFEPGPLGYKLLAGEDSVQNQPQEIYEYNETAGKWVKVN